MEQYVQKLHINDNAFEGMRKDADRVLQRLIKNMIDKDSLEGKVTISIDVSLIQEFIPNNDPRIEGETRRVLTPKFSHKVGSVMQIKNETKGEKNYDGMELVFDDDKGEYVLKPIANTDQMTIFDAEFTEIFEEDPQVYEEPALEGRKVVGLPDLSEEMMEVKDEEKFFEDEGWPYSSDEDDYDYEEPENL